MMKKCHTPIIVALLSVLLATGMTLDSPPPLQPNSFHRPGGNQIGMFYIAPLVNYSEYDSFFGVVAAIPLGVFSFSPYYYHGSLAGSFMGGVLRHPFYESERRDLNIEWFTSVGSEKSLAYVVDATGATKVEVLEESYVSGLGAGATKRWTNHLGVSTQVHLLRSGLTGGVQALPTLYGFAGWTYGYSFFAGIINNDPMAGFEVGFARIGYNFNTETLSVGISAVIF